MTVDPDTTVGQLVTERLGRAAVLDIYGIDYCCGGHRTLSELRDDDGVDIEALERDLTRADEAADEPAPAWAELGPAELADHLETTHHRYVRGAIDRIQPLLAKVVSVHGDAHPELHQVRTVFGAIAADMIPHLEREERVLFPMVRELAVADAPPAFHCGTLANPIRVMGTEHDMVGDHLRQLRALTGGYETPADGCDSYRALFAALEEFERDTHLHVHKENNVLFPAVLRREAQLAADT